MSTQITYPRPFIADVDGKPMDVGSVYIGQLNQDPELFPVSTYWDSSLTTVATQPLAVSAGYILHNGARAAVYTGVSSYSMRIRNRSGSQVDYLPEVTSSSAETTYVTVERFGAVGDGVTNDRAAIQAAIDYAITNGIHEVRFMSKAYTAKPSTRVPGGFGGINPTGDMIVIDSSLSAAPFSVKLTGLPGGTTVTTIGYNTGSSTDTDYQLVGGNPWRGGGIQLYGTQADEANYSNPDLWKLQCFEMENITINGGRTAGSKIPNSTDTSNKGIYTFNAVRKIVLRNGGATKFGHELLYGGGTGYGTGTLHPMEVYLENFKAVSSNHSCLNFQDANLTDINGEYGDAYIAAEQYGMDSKFIGTVFRDANQLNYSAADRSLIPAGEGYDFPSQGSSLRKTQLLGVTHRNVDFVIVGPFTYGSANNIDSQFNFNPLSLSCDLDLTQTVDQVNNLTALTMNGPPAVPTGAKTGMLPRDLHIRLSCKATPAAVNAGRNFGSIIQFSGYMDPDSVVIEVDCSATADQGSIANAPKHAMPHIIWNSWTTWNNAFPANTQLVPGYSTGGITSSALDPTTGGATLYPAGTAGGEDMTFGTIGSGGAYEGFAHGQKFEFFFGALPGRFNFAKSGTGMALTRNRVCFQAGDHITFEYNKRLDKWTDVGGFTSDFLEGSKTYDWPSIAAGATSTTTVTVTGAALGDYVDSISHGVSLAGMNCTGYVSAADTVTLVMTNPAAGAIDLASTTVRVTVQRI